MARNHTMDGPIMGAEPEAPLSERGARLALASVTAVLFLTFLDTTIMTVALADVQTKLHAGVASLQWVLNSYALTFAAFMLAFGTLSDRLGRKRLMLAGVVVFAAGSLLGALAPNVSVLIAARAVMGVGAAACEPGTLSILRHVYPERRRRAIAYGAWAAIAGLALALGPVFGGLLTGAGGWEAILWFNVAAAAAVFVFALWVVPESRDPQAQRGFDWPGLLLGPGGLALLIFAVILGESRSYTHPLVLGLFAAGATAVVAFVFAERFSRAPLLDVRYLRTAPFSGSLAVAFAAYFGVFSIFFLTALYLQLVIGYSAYRTAAMFAPMAFALIVSSAGAGFWVARSGPRTPVVVGSVAAGAGVLLTDLALRTPVTFVWLALALTLAGVGFGIAIVPVTSVAMGVVPASHSGMAASATTTSREVGTVIGVAVLGALFNRQLTADLTRRLTDLGIPPDFQQTVITAVETGQVPAGGPGGASAAQQQYGDIVAKVIDATYRAVHTGVTISLAAAGCFILMGGLVAWFTFGRARSDVGS
jgi:EmrB/QacA subfamily drug resistance transporter